MIILFILGNRTDLFKNTIIGGITLIFFALCTLPKIYNIQADLVWTIIILGIIAISAIMSSAQDYLSKKLENIIKAEFLDEMVKVFGDDFRWSVGDSLIKANDIKRYCFLNYFSRIENDDNFTGTYKNIKVKLSESKLIRRSFLSRGGNETVINFSGLLVEFEMNKSFKGHTLITNDGFNWRMILIDDDDKKRFSKLKKVNLEDVEFEKYHDVFSTDQIEARYLITTAFMERFKNIRKVFRTNSVKCSFKNNKILLAISTRRDLFKMGSLIKPVGDLKQMQKFFDDVMAVLSLIDVLKLDLDTGL